MKKKILAIIMCIIMGVTPILCMPVAAEEAIGKLTITEINTALDGPDATSWGTYPYSKSYQYIEVVNNSEANVDLADYYIFRYSYNNMDGAKVWTNLKHLLGDASKNRNLHKVKVTDEETILEPGEVALLWLNHTDKVEEDFKTFWSAHAVIPEGVTIVNVNTYGYQIRLANDGSFGRAGDAFLPIHLINCIVELVNVNNTYSGVNAETDTATNISDTALVKARHAAADCLALHITSHESTWDAKDSVMENGSVTSRHFYAYANATKYYTNATLLAPSLKINNDICENTAPAVFDRSKIESWLGNLVHGKLDNDGNYAVGSGLAQYVNNISKDTSAGNDQHGLFFDDGTDATPTPGVVNIGQFGKTDGEEIPPEGLGGNTNTEDGSANNNENTNNTNNSNVTDTETEAATEPETTAADPEVEESGCGSVIGGSILAMTVIPVGIMISKKKKKD